MTGFQSGPNRGYIGQTLAPLGYALFNGSDAYGTIPAPTVPFNPTNNFTIEAIINTSFSGTSQMIYSTTNQLAFVYFQVAADGKIWAIIRDDALSQAVVISTNTMNNGANRYVAMTVDLTANEMKVFIDGIQDGPTGDVTAIVLPITHIDVDVGALHQGAIRALFFNGKMNSVHYTNKTKTPAEILATQTAGILASDGSTVALWQFFSGDMLDKVNSNDLTNINVLLK